MTNYNKLYWDAVDNTASIDNLSVRDVNAVFHQFTTQVILHNFGINDLKRPNVCYTGRCVELPNVQTYAGDIKTFILVFDFMNTMLVRRIVATVTIDMTTSMVTATVLNGWDRHGSGICGPLDLTTGPEICERYGNIRACADYLLAKAA